MVSWKYGFESLLILLETRGIHIGHVVREDLHPAFMGQRSGQDRIDTPIHMPTPFCFRETATLVPDSPTRYLSDIHQRAIGNEPIP
jgi:hypothetical protein